ncbi:Heavy metal translocating P-type ATPase [Bacillus cereus Rock3-28]|nr:Heavy metal translocating P-type ATPase [Bacillus cereus Rock3-28]
MAVAEEQHEDTFSGLGPQQDAEELFSVFTVSVLLLQQESSLAIVTTGISFLEEQHDVVSFAFPIFTVSWSPLQQETSLVATGTIGISFLEEQHDDFLCCIPSVVGVDEDSL